MADVVNVSLQIGAGALATMALVALTRRIVLSDSIVSRKNEDTKKAAIDVLPGVQSMRLAANIFVTNPVHADNDKYLAIPASREQKTGNSLTVSVWMQIPVAAADEDFEEHILLRGSIRPSTVKLGTSPENEVTTTTYAVACPLIKVVNRKAIVVQFNTAKSILNVMSTSLASDTHATFNQTTWNLYTFVFEDFRASDGTPSGTSASVYINMQKVNTYVANNDPLKLNGGNLYTCWDAKAGVPPIMIANLKYYNYALQPPQIEANFRANVRLDPPPVKVVPDDALQSLYTSVPNERAAYPPGHA